MKLLTPKWNETPLWWPRIEGWIEKAIMYGGGVTLAPRDIYDGLMNRTFKLWLALDGELLKACCVTQVNQYPRMRVLGILIVSGEDMDGWVHFRTDVERYAQTLDCDGAEFGGRFGWGRAMKPHGYEHVYSLHRKMF